MSMLCVAVPLVAVAKVPVLDVAKVPVLDVAKVPVLDAPGFDLTETFDTVTDVVVVEDSVFVVDEIVVDTVVEMLGDVVPGPA